MFDNSKKILFLAFAGVLFIATPVLAADSDFEISPTGALFGETNLAPGEQVGPKTLTLKNNTSYTQEIKLKITNYHDSIPVFPWQSVVSLGDKIDMKIKDGTNVLYDGTLADLKNQEINFNLAPGSKNLTFNAFFDETADNSYQGSSVSFDLQFNARWEGGDETVYVPGTTPGARARIAGTITGGGTAGAGDVTGGTIGPGVFTALESPEVLSSEDTTEEEEEVPKKGGDVEGEEKEKGFWNKLRSAIDDILPPFCVDLTSILWLFIGIGAGTLGHYLLNKKWGSSAGGGMAATSFLGLFWSQCSFWWLIIGIMIGYIVADLLRRRKQKKEKKTPMIT